MTATISAGKKESPLREPLAYRVRPKKLADFTGQEHIVGEGMPLRSAIEKDALSSVILAGPPGTGKTTLAKIIAEQTSADFVQLNAVMSGVKELKEICTRAAAIHESQLLQPLKRRTILFIDEIHRFNTAQQDALLPFVESGAVILIGATTHNPYFEVNQALVSRSQVYLLQSLAPEHLLQILRHALRHPEGFGGNVHVTEDALRYIANIGAGDARAALNALELAIASIGKNLTFEGAEKLLQKQGVRYDRDREDHYNTISAFIKSMRGSDPDAALLWMFKMLAGGEEPRFLFRRMAIFASEDVGNADPRALQLVISLWQAFEFVGLPEGEFFLAHACVYLAQAPKSNAITRAMGGAKHTVREAPMLEIPNHLRNAPMKGMRDPTPPSRGEGLRGASQGYGSGYQYPHDDPRGTVSANYFPVGMAPENFYEPSDRGFEAEVRERLEKMKKIIRRSSDS